jgi:hypothetical protein
MSESFDRKPGPRHSGLRAGRLGGSDGDHPHRTDPEPVASAASPMSRHTAEWVLASLLGAGIMLMCMAPLVVLDLLFWQPAGLAFAGTAISAAALVTTILMSVGTILIILSIPRNRGEA